MLRVSNVTRTPAPTVHWDADTLDAFHPQWAARVRAHQHRQRLSCRRHAVEPELALLRQFNATASRELLYPSRLPEGVDRETLRDFNPKWADECGCVSSCGGDCGCGCGEGCKEAQKGGCSGDGNASSHRQRTRGSLSLSETSPRILPLVMQFSEVGGFKNIALGSFGFTPAEPPPDETPDDPTPGGGTSGEPIDIEQVCRDREKELSTETQAVACYPLPSGEGCMCWDIEEITSVGEPPSGPGGPGGEPPPPPPDPPEPGPVPPLGGGGIPWVDQFDCGKLDEDPAKLAQKLLTCANTCHHSCVQTCTWVFIRWAEDGTPICEPQATCAPCGSEDDGTWIPPDWEPLPAPPGRRPRRFGL